MTEQNKQSYHQPNQTKQTINRINYTKYIFFGSKPDYYVTTCVHGVAYVRHTERGRRRWRRGTTRTSRLGSMTRWRRCSESSNRSFSSGTTGGRSGGSATTSCAVSSSCYRSWKSFATSHNPLRKTASLGQSNSRRRYCSPRIC